MTDEELNIITKVARKVAHKFVFGYYDYEDMVQEGIIEGMEGLQRWDRQRPLAAFMYTHISNRLKNIMRNKYFRLNINCIKHQEFDENCEVCNSKLRKNNVKKNLIDTMDIDEVVSEEDNEFNVKEESVAEETAIVNEIEERLLNVLTYNERLDYLRLKDGFKIPYARRLKLEAAILGILSDEE